MFWFVYLLVYFELMYLYENWHVIVHNVTLTTWVIWAVCYCDTLCGVLCVASDIQAELEKELSEGMPAVKQLPDREYSGMFEYRREDEPLLIKNLIIGQSLCGILFIAGILYFKADNF